MIVPIRLRISNAFLIKEARPILVDTGCPGDADALLRALAKEDVAPRDLALILHTHGHRDHAGGTHHLKQLTRAPTAIHPADADMLREGSNRTLKPLNLTARLIRPFVDKPFPALEPDLLVDEGTDLKPFGVRGRVLCTPGHTAGSIAILLENGEALAGDLMVGGYLGGAIAPHAPGYPYYAEDLATLHRSIKRLLEHSLTWVYVGHGGPLYAQDIRKRWAV
jgi:glyoxylase-like metal-dependent hydrolase (beta-lactamase superfamily II)